MIRAWGQIPNDENRASSHQQGATSSLLGAGGSKLEFYDLIVNAGRMIELNDFYNAGFGWICRHCERELKQNAPHNRISRLMHEGEAESKQPTLSTQALAKWADPAERILVCPRCGVTEAADKV